MHSQILRVACFLALVFLSGCATYSDGMREAQRDVQLGRPDAAIAQINERLEVDRSTDLPGSLDGDKGLLLLERGTLLQATGDPEGAARDMMIADQRLDWLDMSTTAADDVANWMYSGSSAKYRAPAYERLLLNTLNMINFMLMRDFSGARVEARRFAIMETFFLDQGSAPELPDILALGNYLGGVAFEAGRSWDEAGRFYSRAWSLGMRDDAFRAQFVDLMRATGYKPVGEDPSLEELHVQAQLMGSLTLSEYRRKHVDGNVVIVLQNGMVPYKVAERLPIGAALVYGSNNRAYMSDEAYRQANELAVSGALKWLNFPMLTWNGTPGLIPPTLNIGGRSANPMVVTDVGREVEIGWAKMSGPLIAAALTRMVTRAIAGAVTREATKAATDSQGAGAASAIGILAQLAVEGTLTALDRPDTRSWTTLPAEIRVYRLKAESSPLQVTANVRGQTDRRQVVVTPDNLTVVNFSRYR
ncbi:MAG: hypothetical protein R3E66_17965 [bacterium]